MPSPDSVEQALQLDPADRGAALAGLRESQWLERKSAGVSAQTLADVIVGLANAEGGAVIVGVSDDGIVEGITRGGSRRLEGWQRAGVDFVDPPPRCRPHLVDCVTAAGEADRLFVMTVESSADRVHANNRDEVFLRVGASKRKLTFSQRQELLYDKGQAAFEITEPAGATLNDLDGELIKDYAELLGHPDSRRLLDARGLLSRSGVVTIAAVLLFGREPQRWLHEAYVRVLRYRGSARGTGARQQLLSDVRVDGPIPRMLADARREILDQLPTRRALSSSGRFEPVPLLPADVWLEGLVNAVVHRSYSFSGDHIRVEIFDDRMEISGPGRFPGVFDVDNPLKIGRFARNPRIARVCTDLGWGQELGEGIRRMFEQMKREGLADPQYRQTSGSVHLTLSWATVRRQDYDCLPERARVLLGLLAQAGRLGTGEMAEATGWSRPVVLSHLRALKEAGLIAWVGQSRHDPRAYWRPGP